MIKFGFRAGALVACSVVSLWTGPAWGDTFTSVVTGNWNANATWGATNYPRTATTDSVLIQGGYTVNYVGGGIGLIRQNGATTSDFGVENGNTITVNGGTLQQTNATAGWIRVGNQSTGTLDIKDGGAYLNGFLQLGVEGASAVGIVNVGDGTGAAGSAVLSLRFLADGTTTTSNSRANEINVGGAEAAYGGYGIITVESDGYLEGDDSGVIRIGRYGSGSSQPTTQSALIIKAGGQVVSHAATEVGSLAGANGLLHISGTGAKMTQDAGELTIGYTGTGTFILENSAQYLRTTTAGGSQFLGRNSTGVGTMIIRTNAQFIRSVGDFHVGDNGTGSLTIESGGLFLSQTGNWDWIGRRTGSNGTVEVKTAGLYRLTGNASLVLGSAANSNGTLIVSGGSFTMEFATGGEMRVGESGNATFRQTSGSSAIRRVVMSTTAGTSTFDMQGGTFSTREDFLMGGASATAANTSTVTATQSGGSVGIAGNHSIGMGIGSNASYTMTGGSVTHSTGSTTVGYSGTGRLTVGAGATYTDDSVTEMYVGRENGSNGTLIVDGTLTKNATSGIRVGSGNSATLFNNTTGVGLIGGTGTINAQYGITVGGRGRIGAGLNNTIGTLTVNGTIDLYADFGDSNQSTLFVNFDSSHALKADRLVVNGNIILNNAKIDGTWAAGSETGVDSRYWVVVNEGGNQFLGDGYFANMTLNSLNDWASIYLGMGANGFVTIGGQEFAMFYSADFSTGALTGGNDLMLSAMSLAPVPEPGLSMLSLIGLAAVVLRRRRR